MKMQAILVESRPLAVRSLSAPLHVQLTSRQRRRLRELRRDPTLQSRERDRVEMNLLSADGMTVSRLTRYFGCCEATLRRWIHQFETESRREKHLSALDDWKRRWSKHRKGKIDPCSPMAGSGAEKLLTL